MADNMITNESGTVHTIKVKFGLCGPQGPKGDTGAQGPAGATGPAGKSAYELAVDNGFSGTETEWLKSLGKEANTSTVLTFDAGTTPVIKVERTEKSAVFYVFIQSENQSESLTLLANGYDGGYTKNFVSILSNASGIQDVGFASDDSKDLAMLIKMYPTDTSKANTYRVTVRPLASAESITTEADSCTYTISKGDSSVSILSSDTSLVRQHGNVGSGLVSILSEVGVNGNINASGEIRATGPVTARVPNYMDTSSSYLVSADYVHYQISQLQSSMQRDVSQMVQSMDWGNTTNKGGMLSLYSSMPGIFHMMGILFPVVFFKSDITKTFSGIQMRCVANDRQGPVAAVTLDSKEAMYGNVNTSGPSDSHIVPYSAAMYPMALELTIPNSSTAAITGVTCTAPFRHTSSNAYVDNPTISNDTVLNASIGEKTATGKTVLTIFGDCCIDFTTETIGG